MFLANVGNGLMKRYDAGGEIADLNRAVDMLERAVGQTPPGSPDRPERPSSLGSALSARYDHGGEVAALQQAIKRFEEALEGAGAGSASRQVWLTNLASSLSRRYDHSGDCADLDRAIDAFERAVDRTPPRSTDLPARVASLAGGLLDRYRRGGDVADLTRAVEAYERAVAETPPGSPNLPAFLNNLGNGLRARHDRLGGSDDLIRAVQAYRSSSRSGLEVRAEAGLIAARTWGGWAARRGSWAEAAEALGYGLEAADRLFAVQLSRRYKESWLRWGSAWRPRRPMPGPRSVRCPGRLPPWKPAGPSCWPRSSTAPGCRWSGWSSTGEATSPTATAGLLAASSSSSAWGPARRGRQPEPSAKDGRGQGRPGTRASTALASRSLTRRLAAR
jgi:tetratricopeptide (TPR) repeat protein